jgi:CheY-like chemotaxis protein
MEKPRVLLVEPDNDLRESLKELIHKCCPVKVMAVSLINEAVKVVTDWTPQAVPLLLVVEFFGENPQPIIITAIAKGVPPSSIILHSTSPQTMALAKEQSVKWVRKPQLPIQALEKALAHLTEEK